MMADEVPMDNLSPASAEASSGSTLNNNDKINGGNGSSSNHTNTSSNKSNSQHAKSNQHQPVVVAEEEDDDPYALTFPFPEPYKKQIFRFFNNPESSKEARVFYLVVSLAILLSTITFIVATLPSYRKESAHHSKHMLQTIETTCIALFTFEYIVRILTTRNIRRFVTQPITIVDFLSFFPFYIQLIIGRSLQGFVIIRAIRLTRLFRLIRFSAYKSSFKLIVGSLSRSLNELKVMTFLVFILVIVCSSAMYYAELTAECLTPQDGYLYHSPGGSNELCKMIENGEIEDPKEFKAFFQSIPDAMWWAFVTVTTVGYGDSYPRTSVGRAIAVITMFLGLIVLAFPITVIGTNFSDLWEEMRTSEKVDVIGGDDDEEEGSVTDGEDGRAAIQTVDVTQLRIDKLKAFQAEVEQQLKQTRDKFEEYQVLSMKIIDDLNGQLHRQQHHQL